jgi:EAL domain-containing protein (putative c-di-GMP-specific phosphodiesterase class I)
MPKLDKIILKKVIKNIDKIKKLTPRLFLNIFPPSLNDREITKLIIELADKLYENNIEFFLELTEYAITANKNILNLLEKTKKLYLAFDDFGTGYTNYELVGQLAEHKNAKAIKIDGSLVKRINESKVYYSIVSSISAFAKELDMYIVYEFVENEEIFNTLKKLTKNIGAKKDQLIFYQGWHFDKAEKI